MHILYDSGRAKYSENQVYNDFKGNSFFHRIFTLKLLLHGLESCIATSHIVLSDVIITDFYCTNECH